MGGGRAPSMPGPSQEERNLQQQQANLIAQQTSMLQQQIQQQNMLAPYLFQELGLIPQYNAQGVITGFTQDPQYAQQQSLQRQLGLQTLQGQVALQPLQLQLAQQQLGMGPLQLQLMEQQLRQQQEFMPLQTELARLQLSQQKELVPLQMQTLREQLSMGREQFGFEKEMAMRQMGYTEAQIARQAQIDAEVRTEQAEAKRMQGLLAPYAYEQMGLRAQIGPGGQIVGFEKIVDPLEEQRKAVEAQYLERTQKALRGELPVDPTLRRELTEQEAEVKETLRRQLGTGYETSTPGAEVLARQRQAEAEALSAAGRGELTLSEQLGLARETGRRQKEQLGGALTTGLGGFLGQESQQARQELLGLQGRGGVGGAQAPSGGTFANAARLAASLGGGGIQMPGGGGVAMPQIQMPGMGGGGAFPSGASRLQQLIGLTGAGGASYEGIMGGLGKLSGTLGQWRGQAFQSNLADFQAKQAESQMYAGLGGAGLAAGAAAAVAAGGALFSSRRVKRDIRRADEQRLRDELAGEA